MARWDPRDRETAPAPARADPPPRAEPPLNGEGRYPTKEEQFAGALAERYPKDRWPSIQWPSEGLLDVHPTRWKRIAAGPSRLTITIDYDGDDPYLRRLSHIEIDTSGDVPVVTVFVGRPPHVSPEQAARAPRGRGALTTVVDVPAPLDVSDAIDGYEMHR